MGSSRLTVCPSPPAPCVSVNNSPSLHWRQSQTRRVSQDRVASRHLLHWFRNSEVSSRTGLAPLCLTGLAEVAMPYSDTWQDCQITFPHTRPCYAKSSYRSVDPRPYMETSTRSTTYQMDRPTRRDNNVPIATLWRQAIGRGHSRATLRSETTTR